ncbi:hypothetical protein M513_09432 [Trichuris suis]|uniref:Reverse transcriptase domain-containing protein n=1 Tax=Trichuris suis TaxID=68888 RepID=A0A085LXN9_9BILA|nr:hypothetical protein M513_09432 [Trichuris suis]
MLEKFWSTEAFGTKPKVMPPTSVEERLSRELLCATTTKRNNRYEVGLLWKEPNCRLPNNRAQALVRLAGLQRRLSSDASLKEAYDAAINDLLTRGIAKRLEGTEIHHPWGRMWYLPHHPVQRANRPGKVRIVFDASAKYNGISLNDMLSKGPPLLNDLCGILLRFRRYEVAISADVDRVFHQVLVPVKDQSVLGFI